MINAAYEEFLSFAFSEGIVLWSDPSLRTRLHTDAYWDGKKGIFIFRPGNLVGISSVSINAGTPPTLQKFVSDSLNPFSELCLILHEFGHFHHKHAHASVRTRKVYFEEVEAWDHARITAWKLKIKWDLKFWREFFKQKHKGLLSYRKTLPLGIWMLRDLRNRIF